ncbi:hypothetical protein [Gilvimarinus japonicus]|jgi:hypothetical protein|uniref:Uncharacterized protein n=1 Tax=Gilvimarinus japonicus TaxID=1796469 RepID=A0ABV7HXD6_9GAMM|tara:strand:+ start:344 stop:565 length:222 start_codon:yes stop_codon:yes gene_type:complete
MQRTALASLPPESAKFSVMHRVENDIVSISRKIQRLEHEPRGNAQLLAAYRLMLQTRTEVLACLLETLERDTH